MSERDVCGEGGGEVASPAYEEENVGVVRVFCPSCGGEICGIKYNSVIYWKRLCEHVDVVRVGCDRDVRDVIRELEEEGGEILETVRDGGYEVVIAHFDDTGTDAHEERNASVLDEIRREEAEIRELCDYIKEHLNCIDCTTDDLINVAERIVTKLHVIRQLEEKL